MKVPSLSKYTDLAVVTGAVVAIAVAVLTLLSACAAQRAAQAARDQVELAAAPALLNTALNAPLARYHFGDLNYDVTLPAGDKHGVEFVLAHGRIYAALALRNRGLGIAIVKGASLDTLDTTPAEGWEFVGNYSFPIASGDTWVFDGWTYQGSNLAKLRQAVQTGRRLAFSVYYTDLLGSQKFTTRLYIWRPQGSNEWVPTVPVALTRRWEDGFAPLQTKDAPGS